MCVNFNGDVDREWAIENSVTTYKVAGGPTKKESVILGLEDGSIVKLILDNPFPVLIHKHTI